MTLRVSKPPEKPILVYDGGCSFCLRWINRWRRVAGKDIDNVSYQLASSWFPEVPREDLKRSVHFIEPSGEVTCGAQAVFRSLRGSKGLGWLDLLYRWLPGFAFLAEWAYRWVARHRGSL